MEEKVELDGKQEKERARRIRRKDAWKEEKERRESKVKMKRVFKRKEIG